MDYKNTLNLPKTDFSMKANLSVREPQILTQWEKLGLYQCMRQASKGRELFILHDGPPYANGRIHMGHVFNKILKDIIVRYKSLRGFDAPYIPGWDCHGLPVEHQLFKDLKKTKDEIGRVEFRKLAFDYAMKYVDIQREEFKRLGIIGDWQHPYLTLDKGYEHTILNSFAKLVEKGYVYRGLKPVNWCFKCETALAEAEVEYAEHESDSIFVKFELVRDKKAAALGIVSEKDTFILIWTTTPWTLISNVAVAVHPSLDYLLISKGEANLILAKELFYASLKEALQLKDYKVLSEFKGKDLEGLVYKHPFGLREGKVVLADYVSKEDGTGCVHTAPGHGQEDFMTGLKYKLDTIMPVDAKGLFDRKVKDFAGLHVFKANQEIVKKLDRLKRLQFSSKVSHTYPHCWRCKSPVIFRATEQWFLNIDHQGLRKRLLASIAKDVNWVPSQGRERISTMVESRPDWCLSRQRYWGVPIPALICASCKRHILEAAIIEKVAERVVSEGADVWFTADVSEFLPKKFSCSCGAATFEKSTDILDVWFDSGVSHQAVLKGKPGLKLPSDLYLEGSDQHRGWFQASLIPSMAIDGRPPYTSVLTHGFVVDGQGRKMSKSLGNVISPQDIIKDYGADILRLWVLSSDYSEDIRISRELLKPVADAYRKIRNTVRFLLGNLYDYNPARDTVPQEEMLDIDRWAIFKLYRLIDEATQAYEAYKFYHVFQKIYKFCNEDMSSLYLDILKDRLYTCGKKSKLRRSAQTALYEILTSLIRLLAPVLPFTSEEIHQCCIKQEDTGFNSIHLSGWPKIKHEYEVCETDVRDINKVLSFRPQVLKGLEEERGKAKIGSSLEAKVILFFKEEGTYEVFTHFKEQLPFIFIVSGAEVILRKEQDNVFEVSITKAEGKKCPRCWNYSIDLAASKDHPGICGRCLTAIKEN